VDTLVLSAWCGLSAGLLEVATRVSCRAFDQSGRLIEMSRHFVWLTPLSNLLVFLGAGLCLAAITRLWPRPGGWLSTRLLSALGIVPALMVAAPRIFPEAWFVLALGVACQLVPRLEPHANQLRRWLPWSFPALLGSVVLLAGSVPYTDWLKERREAGRALPPADAPNVLFIVLDTVRADRLSVYGYQRPTTPTLEHLARKGIRFDHARATAPWTLASHASFFSGCWPHELGVEWLTPLRKNVPMLAEYVGSRGYATAGFVANVQYCSYDTGLGRGFTHYEDYLLAKLNPLRTSVIVEEALRTFLIVSARHEVGPLHDLHDFLQFWFRFAVRRDAGSINRGILNWLDGRRDQGRPFFVFLNYFDAHVPYELPVGAPHRFGRKPQTRDELSVIHDNWTYLDKLDLPRHYLTLARDCYDNCLSYLDERLGELFGELQKRGVFDRTWVVITSDHGEGFGEHGLFQHGDSLYSTETHVPLLIVPPTSTRGWGGVVRETVTLRDLPATVVDVVGLARRAPFPGTSLARLWSEPQPRARQFAGDAALSELPRPNPSDPNHGRSPAQYGPLVALAEGDFVYIRNEGDGAEELFNERDDPRELTNRAWDDSLKPVLGRFRECLARVKGSHGVATSHSP
jgi:arylsulfatase A-like enzyme